jgi:hypothetical protein
MLAKGHIVAACSLFTATIVCAFISVVFVYITSGYLLFYTLICGGVIHTGLLPPFFYLWCGTLLLCVGPYGCEWWLSLVCSCFLWCASLFSFCGPVSHFHKDTPLLPQGDHSHPQLHTGCLFHQIQTNTPHQTQPNDPRNHQTTVCTTIHHPPTLVTHTHTPASRVVGEGKGATSLVVSCCHYHLLSVWLLCGCHWCCGCPIVVVVAASAVSGLWWCPCCGTSRVVVICSWLPLCGSGHAVVVWSW